MAGDLDFKTHDIADNITSRYDQEREKLVLEIDLKGKGKITDDGRYRVLVLMGNTDVNDVLPFMELRVWCAYRHF